MTDYVPVLKCKKGELAALSHLTTERLMPVLEILDADGDIATYLGGKLRDVARSWNGFAYIDVGAVQVEPGDTHPVVALIAAAGDEERKFGIVVRMADSEEVLTAATGYSREFGVPVLLRLSRRDFSGRPDVVETRLTAALSSLGMENREVDIMLDFGSLDESDVDLAAAYVDALISASKVLQDCRMLILAGSGFPAESIPAAYTWVEATRTEWLLWERVADDDATARIPVFSDYGAGPVEAPALPPGYIALSAKIKYTLDDRWLLIRSRQTNSGGEEGNEQFNTLCSLLLSRGLFLGQALSWGDAKIAQCAADPDAGPGNATTWVTVAMSHHLEFVLNQLANRP